MCFAEKVGRISQSEQRRVSQAAHFRDGIIWTIWNIICEMQVIMNITKVHKVNMAKTEIWNSMYQYMSNTGIIDTCMLNWAGMPNCINFLCTLNPISQTCRYLGSFFYQA
jgi:hypothetical protein